VADLLKIAWAFSQSIAMVLGAAGKKHNIRLLAVVTLVCFPVLSPGKPVGTGAINDLLNVYA
jgi:hypothetical protein